MKLWLKFCFILGLCVHLNACVTQKVTLPSVEDQESRWEKFTTAAIDEHPYTLQGSFRFGDKENTNRVNYIFWSNGSLPLRVDVMAGVGASIAKIREDAEEVLIYFVQDKKAMLMENYHEMNPLVSLGMPVPISFYEMSLLLRGGFNQVLQELNLDSVKTFEKAKNEFEKYSYYFSSINMDGLLQLNENGMPVHCEIDNTWAFDLSYDEKTMLPSRVVISSLIDDYKAILLVKERSNPPQYKKEDLIFELPAGTEFIKE